MAGFSSKKTSVVDTFRNAEGQTVKIIKVNGKSAYEVGSRSHQLHVPSGEVRKGSRKDQHHKD